MTKKGEGPGSSMAGEEHVVVRQTDRVVDLHVRICTGAESLHQRVERSNRGAVPRLQKEGAPVRGARLDRRARSPATGCVRGGHRAAQGG